MSLTSNQQAQLLQLARQSITQGLSTGQPVAPPATTDPDLLRPGASFVTLTKDGQLRGCIGTLEARQPLLEDVCQNAFNAAFRDFRFPPLQADELPQVQVEVSVLSAPEDLDCESEAELLQALVPGEDGLIIAEGQHRATFLPQVWEQLPQPAQFVQQLKAKAGLPQNYWSPRLRVQRYRVQKFI